MENTPHSKLKYIAEMEGLSLNDLTVLAPQNDPFRIGTATQVLMATWFAEQWENEGFGPGTHIRRIHYRLQSYSTKTTHKGAPYINDDKSWQYLQNASRYARLLSMVNPRDFKDARNPTPHLFAPEPGHEVFLEKGEASIHVPEISINMNFVNIIEAPRLSNYWYRESDQPYLIEIWIEKSTMNQELIPLCRRNNVNLVGGKGFQSHTSELALIDRCVKLNKSAVVFYISDFDPAGDNMPTAVARFLEFSKSQHGDLDIVLNPIVLTAEQVEHYQLPREPVNEKKKRHHQFEDKYGEGATELDALAALHPGEFEKIVQSAIDKYRNPYIEGKINVSAMQAVDELKEQWDENIKAIQAEGQLLKEAVKAVYAEYSEPLSEIIKNMEVDLAPLRTKAFILRLKAQEVIDDFQFDIPERPVASGWVEGSETEPYYDSARDYAEQLEYHRKRKGRDQAA